jgi:hypothetical protein
MGATALGAGYLVVKHGRLVLQEAKPGIIDSCRALEYVTRNARAGALVVYDVAGNVVAGIAQAAGQAATSTIDMGARAAGATAIFSR